MSEPETIRFPVAGMTCPSCVNRITRSLKHVEGVSKVRVDLQHETATVHRDRDRATDAALAAAVAEAGYTADLAAAVVVPEIEQRGFLDRLLGR